jgi:hypothetical protein
MKSKLLTEVNILQDASGEFPCIINSGGNNNQLAHDICANSNHPDDITMVMIAAHEQYMMANQTELIDTIYPLLLKSFGYYKKYYDSSPWVVPYTAHETYDALKESANITGEGTVGYSMYFATALWGGGGGGSV